MPILFKTNGVSLREKRLREKTLLVKVTEKKNLAQHEKELSMFRSATEKQEAMKLPLKVKSIHTGIFRPSVGCALEEIPVLGGRMTSGLPLSIMVNS